jgi:peptide/nickel transport system permease protein
MTVTAIDEVMIADVAPVQPRGVFRTALRSWRTRAGLVLVAIVVGFAIIGPWVAPHGQTEFVGTPNTRNVEGLLFGTDFLGQDVWSRFLYGGRTILLLAVSATAIGLIVGTIIGLVAAYDRGHLDNLLMRTVDVMLAFPALLLLLVAITTLGRHSWVVILLASFTVIPRVARITRGAALGVVERDFIGAAEALGESRTYILRKEVLPNVAGPLLVEANLRLTYTIFLLSTLGFLGLGVALNRADWAQMINEGRPALSTQPWAVVLPILAIAMLTIGFGLIADGLGRAIAGIDRGRPE